MKESNFDGYTGRLLEAEIMPMLSDSWRSEGYFNEQKSYDWVREHQTWNPSDPDIRIANDLHYLVGQKLGLDDFNELKFYSAINSPLDYFYGIDGFFEIGDARFTLDITKNPHKLTHKADYVVHEDITDDKGREALSEIIASFLKNNKVRRIARAA